MFDAGECYVFAGKLGSTDPNGGSMNERANSRLVVVRAGYDDDARVWYVQNSDIPGVHAEGSTLDELRDKLPTIIRDLIEASGEPFRID